MNIDETYLMDSLKLLLAIPSPVGYTHQIENFVSDELTNLGVKWERRRRGTLVATIHGDRRTPDRALTAHLDTIGAMVSHILPNGRLQLTPLGSWSARFAEGGRVTIFGEGEPQRGSVLPLRSSGHTFGDLVDELPISWANVECRVDAVCENETQIRSLGIGVGSFLAFDPNPEFLPSGHIVSRHLDNKAGVACLLAAIKAVKNQVETLPIECHPIFSLSEETGCGAGHAPDSDVGELISIDIGPVADGQNSSEHTVNIGIKDSSGVYDTQLLRQLVSLCDQENLEHRLDIYPYYRSDTNSAIVAGRDLRHGLIAFGTESTHGYERTHSDSLMAVSKLLATYMLSK